MNKIALIFGIAFLVLAVLVFVLADGLRRWYSGLFFAVIGAILVTIAMRSRTAERTP